MQIRNATAVEAECATVRERNETDEEDEKDLEEGIGRRKGKRADWFGSRNIKGKRSKKNKIEFNWARFSSGLLSDKLNRFDPRKKI